MDSEQEDIVSRPAAQDRCSQPLGDEPADGYAFLAPVAGNNTNVANPSPHDKPFWYRIQQHYRQDMKPIERRRFFQFILHDIKNELHEGDTLVFVDFPPHTQLSERADCFCYAWNSVQFRMHSERLLGTGSSKFAEMLNPTYQFRIRRRRKLVKSLPDGVKYVLDLTPPTEGDELVFQMTEVSLTPGIITWWTATSKHGVDSNAVSGHDDVCSCWKNRESKKYGEVDVALENISANEPKRDQNQDRDSDMDRATGMANLQSLREATSQTGRPKQQAPTPTMDLAAKVLVKKSKGDFAADPVPAYRQIPDYCPVRHRVNILRLMYLISDKCVFLDSAPSVWTLVAVAKILDCTSVVRGPFLHWFMSPNNTMFLEVLPEESLQIGVALKLADVTRSAFRILVNELALEEAAEPNGTPKAAAYTVFGRKRHDPGDDLNNIIQHAARAMVERVSRSVNQLVSETIFDDLQLAEWLRLRNIIGMLSSCPDDPMFQRAKKTALILADSLKAAWKEHVVCILLEKPLDANHLTGADNQLATYIDVRHFNRLDVVHKQLNNVQKALCSFMYKAVANKWLGFARIFPSSCLQPSFSRLATDLWVLLIEILKSRPDLATDPAWEALLDLPQDVTAAIDPGSISLLETDAAKHVFDLQALETPLRAFLEPLSHEYARVDFEIKMKMTPHLLLTLHQDEFKFLPLWAGGDDDGTGGVFEDSLPPADYGPVGPGPIYHTGATIPSETSSTAGSVNSVLRQLRLGGGSTIGPGSVDVQDGISTVFNHNKVVVDEKSIYTESFTDEDSDYGNARSAVPVDCQAMAQTTGIMVLEEETTEHSDIGTSVNLETDDDDDMDGVMMETSPEDSRLRDGTHEHVVSSVGAPVLLASGGQRSSTTPSITNVSSGSHPEEDYDMVMI
ncbi:hypothetical protein CDEST_08498 [Colletotrichum destructivum]|uniref:Uncharacterized protein n=1 Tax=Colletotrichum destructivum TaxID=34406 RepID=A0AAX4IKS8_9PEZI|nr:hypothetical protein CDEST_08498 [Colletotrichum destructivum]